MTLALNIIKARVNSERQLDEMTIDKAIAIYRKYGHFPPVSSRTRDLSSSSMVKMTTRQLKPSSLTLSVK